jgi:hypothetical protein
MNIPNLIIVWVIDSMEAVDMGEEWAVAALVVVQADVKVVPAVAVVVVAAGVVIVEVEVVPVEDAGDAVVVVSH